jgi:ribosomal protein S17E
MMMMMMMIIIIIIISRNDFETNRTYAGNTVHVESKKKVIPAITGATETHLRIIQKITEQHTWKARRQGSI